MMFGNCIEDRFDDYGEDALGPLYGECSGCPALAWAEAVEQEALTYGEIDLEFGSEL